MHANKDENLHHLNIGQSLRCSPATNIFVGTPRSYVAVALTTAVLYDRNVGKVDGV